MGLASGDDDKGFIRFSAEAKAIGAGTFFSIPGALIGGIIGSAKVKIPINGNHRTMKNQKGKLMDIMLLE